MSVARPGPLYLIRHAQAAWQLVRAGDLDSPLTALGHRQARRLAAWARAAKFDNAPQLFTSPLRRARQTSAYLVRPLRRRAEPCGALREATFRVAGHLAPATPAIEQSAPPGDFAAFRAEVASALHILSGASRAGGGVVAVTHGGVIRTILNLAQAPDRKIPNASVTMLRRHGDGWAVEQVGACDHLADDERSC